MTPDEFVRAVMSPSPFTWERWAADWERRLCDCWGLVVLEFGRVRGVDLGPVPHTDIGAGYIEVSRDWRLCDPAPGAVVMCWEGDRPTHCGMLHRGGMVLHCPGASDYPGSARLTTLPAMRRLYGRLTFHEYRPC